MLYAALSTVTVNWFIVVADNDVKHKLGQMA